MEQRYKNQAHSHLKDFGIEYLLVILVMEYMPKHHLRRRLVYGYVIYALSNP